jgi:tRNA-uridine 2-sulfurtransferase
MKVLVGLSGGVDSSVAAALLVEAGHEVVGVTMRLWGGESDSGCCSVADVDDARRVAQQLGIDHLVFNFSDDFERHVVDPYVADHVAGLTPNPCIECNRHLKFDRLADRARVLGFDAVATGHHARVVRAHDDSFELRRSADRSKDQSYVLYMLGQDVLSTTLLPLGDMTKTEVRAIASRLGLRTAAKPDSQDVCFITASDGGRETFLGSRIPFRRATVVDTDGQDVGSVPALELVTLGQRRGLGLPGGGPRRFVVDIDHDRAKVTVGDEQMLMVDAVRIARLSWTGSIPPSGEAVMAQCSAHGEPRAGVLELDADGATAVVRWRRDERRVSPGQSIVLYDRDDERVIGGGIAVV